MGTGIHSGFGNTFGKRIVSASPTYVGKGKGERLASAAKTIKPEKGYLDVVIHGTSEKVAVMHNGTWVYLDQRRLARLIIQDKSYKKGMALRLISCSTGMNSAGFAQNLANKLGVPIKAPSDVLWIHPGGKTTIGPSAFKNTGKWITFHPIHKKGGSK